MTDGYNPTPHLQATVSERGLAYLPPIESDHRIPGGHARVETHTSSAVEPSIWLRVTDELGFGDNGQPMRAATGDIVQLALHLSNEAAVQLAEQILGLTKGEPAIEEARR